jgi:hypothetical protein
MKTAVEWLIEELEQSILMTSSVKTTIKQAKEKEKQQMWNYIESNYVNGENSLAFHKAEFEQYYNETFNK